MSEDIKLNKKEKKIILLVREITQQDSLHLVKTNDKPTYSKKGLKKGCKFTNTFGTKIDITAEKNAEMVSFIQDEILDYEKQKIKMYGPLIIKSVEYKFNISLSPAFVSGIKKKMGEIDGC